MAADNLTTCIFIKTCKKDLDWLDYCLFSIGKFVSGYKELVIVADDDCKGLPFMTLKSPVEFVPMHHNGYINQQIIKLRANEFTDCDLIMYVDSDCVFCRPTTPESFMLDGKPLLLKTHYSQTGDAQCWKEITERVVGFPVEYEYMRRLPFFFRRDTVMNFRRQYPDLIPYLDKKTDRVFSEFNALGAYAEKFESGRYSVRNTADYLPPPQLRQFWSWGGITPEIKKQIEEVLGV